MVCHTPNRALGAIPSGELRSHPSSFAERVSTLTKTLAKANSDLCVGSRFSVLFQRRATLLKVMICMMKLSLRATGDLASCKIITVETS